jgi:hypothetical protein
MMTSSDITNRLIQQNRPIEEFHQPAYENLHTGANRLFTRAFFATIERDLIRGGRRRHEIASLARLRLSPFEIFAQRQPQPLLTPIFAGLSRRPLAVVPTIHHHQPAHRAAHCVGAVLPNQGASDAVPAPGITGPPIYGFGRPEVLSRACALPSLVARIAPLCGALFGRFFDLVSGSERMLP